MISHEYVPIRPNNSTEHNGRTFRTPTEENKVACVIKLVN